MVSYADGSVTPVHLRAAAQQAACAFDEYRIRQTTSDLPIVEITRQEPLDKGGTLGLHDVVASQAGPDVKVEIRWMEPID